MTIKTSSDRSTDSTRRLCPVLDEFERAAVGVLGFTAKDLSPRAVAVTPYVIELPAEAPDGLGCLLVHHETEGMAELLSLTLRGEVADGRLIVASRHGSLEPKEPGTLSQLRELRTLRRAARANLPTIENW